MTGPGIVERGLVLRALQAVLRWGGDIRLDGAAVGLL